MALQVGFSDPDPSPFFADDLIEAAKSGNFSKVGTPAAMCSQGLRWVLAPQPAPLVCPSGRGKPCQLCSTIALELLSRAILQDRWLETMQASGKKPRSLPGGHRGKGLGSVAELGKAPCQVPNIHTTCWAPQGCSAGVWGLKLGKATHLEQSGNPVVPRAAPGWK